MSNPSRFFVPAESLQNDQITIAGDSYHHLRNVLRLKPGSLLVLLDGFGQCCEVRLEQLQTNQATTRVIRRWQAEDYTLPITLIQALPKGDKFDLILQKGTELGVRCFQPIETTHAIPNLGPAKLVKRQQRWQRIVREAARQSKQCFLPEVKPLLTLAKAIDESSQELKLVLWESGSVPLAQGLPRVPPTSASLLIGPEGGFSATEICAITAAGFQPVHLGPRIMRTETAGLASTTILQYLYGDWQLAPVDRHSNQHEETQ